MRSRITIYKIVLWNMPHKQQTMLLFRSICVKGQKRKHTTRWLFWFWFWCFRHSWGHAPMSELGDVNGVIFCLEFWWVVCFPSTSMVPGLVEVSWFFHHQAGQVTRISLFVERAQPAVDHDFWHVEFYVEPLGGLYVYVETIRTKNWEMEHFRMLPLPECNRDKMNGFLVEIPLPKKT